MILFRNIVLERELLVFLFYLKEMLNEEDHEEIQRFLGVCVCVYLLRL